MIQIELESFGKKQEVHGWKTVSSKIVAFLAEWDENEGPKIVDSFPAANKLDLEDITLQIFTGFQTVFGIAEDVSFDRTNLVLPLKSHKITAKILLDSYRNKQVRGGKLPFIIAFLLPLKFVQRELHVYNNIQEKIVDEYAKKKTIVLKDHYPEISKETEHLALKIRDEAEALAKKDKMYWESVEKFRETLFLLKLTKNAVLIEETLKKMEVSVEKYAKEILNSVDAKLKDGNYTQAERDHQLTVRLAKEAKNEKMEKMFTSKLNEFYIRWIKHLESEAKPFLKGKDNVKAREIYEKIVGLAGKTRDDTLAKKYERERDKIPALPPPPRP